MSVFIVHRDGGKTPVDRALLVKLAESRRLEPETTLEVDGIARRAYELSELAPIFRRQGYEEPVVVPTPPRVGEPTPKPEPEPKLESEPDDDSARELSESEIRRLAVKRVDALFRADAFSRTLALVAGFVAILYAIGSIVVDAIRGSSDAGTEFMFRATALGIAFVFYFGIRRAIRTSAILREEATIRQESLLRKLTSDKEA